MNRLTITIITILAAIATLCSCSEDKTVSTIPQFSDIALDADNLTHGMQLTATAVQSRKGTLLNSTRYRWYLTVGGRDSLLLSRDVIYDNDNSNPVCTFRLPDRLGSYTIKFKSEYNASAELGGLPQSGRIPSGTATYNANPVKGFVELTKDIVVRR